MSLSLSKLETETETSLLERLLKIGHGVWWRVENLQSGRSGDVMGEVSPPLSRISKFSNYSSFRVLILIHSDFFFSSPRRSLPIHSAPFTPAPIPAAVAKQTKTRIYPVQNRYNTDSNLPLSGYLLKVPEGGSSKPLASFPLPHSLTILLHNLLHFQLH